jgi:hypothetical protein
MAHCSIVEISDHRFQIPHTKSTGKSWNATDFKGGKKVKKMPPFNKDEMAAASALLTLSRTIPTKRQED